MIGLSICHGAQVSHRCLYFICSKALTFNLIYINFFYFEQIDVQKTKEFQTWLEISNYQKIHLINRIIVYFVYIVQFSPFSIAQFNLHKIHMYIMVSD